MSENTALKKTLYHIDDMMMSFGQLKTHVSYLCLKYASHTVFHTWVCWLLAWGRISHRRQTGCGCCLRCPSRCPGWSLPLRWGSPPHLKSPPASSGGCGGCGIGQTTGYCSRSWNKDRRQYNNNIRETEAGLSALLCMPSRIWVEVNHWKNCKGVTSCLTLLIAAPNWQDNVWAGECT